MSDAGSQRTAPAHRPGRHRRKAGSGPTWTPAVDPVSDGGRHRAPDAPTEEIVPIGSMSGVLPIPLPAEAAAEAPPASESSAAAAAMTAEPAAATASEPAAAVTSEHAASETAPASAENTEAAERPQPDPAAEFEPAHPVAAARQEQASRSIAAALNPEPERPPATATQQPKAPEKAAAAAQKSEPKIAIPAQAAESPEKPRRTKITLTPATEESEDVRVYLAPPVDGLSKFDLGNVPASVTPPRSWRKAAWFATMSSCGVAVALVLAGSYLVSQQPQTNAEVDGWTGFHGKPPITHDEGLADRGPEDEDATRTKSGTSKTPQRIADVADVSDSSSAGNSTPGSTTSQQGSSAPQPSPSEGASSPAPEPPEKPPPTPAPREVKRDAFYNFPPDAQTMGDRSETFLNEVTENPEVAHAQTGGKLHDQGADALAEKYSDVAYFEVKRIYIDQQNRVTVNTVEVTYTDGSTETQQCTLRFEEGDKITQDCR